jgi:hypothetical protein
MFDGNKQTKKINDWNIKATQAIQWQMQTNSLKR